MVSLSTRKMRKGQKGSAEEAIQLLIEALQTITPVSPPGLEGLKQRSHLPLSADGRLLGKWKWQPWDCSRGRHVVSGFIYKEDRKET
ncbi:hypothetical protein JRQ81_012114 [Phrynocephalus forsythii]|uniref:Uncharacterized protein n=1 Tax=Phrynocephalus forsythii TaxID=171643 RepID=A0A9Q1APR6_9SAUR|nr:hypothetical protein JRQ81_012114 [Phrynocephalus forsythii]